MSQPSYLSHQELYEHLSKPKRFTWNIFVAALLLIDGFVVTSSSTPMNIAYAILTFIGSFGFLEYQRNIDDLKESPWRPLFTNIFRILAILMTCCWLIYIPAKIILTAFINTSEKAKPDIVSLWFFGLTICIVFVVLFYKMIYPLLKSILSDIISELPLIFNGSKKFRKSIPQLLIIEILYVCLTVTGARGAIKIAEIAIQ